MQVTCAFAQREVVDFSQLLRTNPRKFWQAARLPNDLPPQELHDPTTWDSFLSKLTAPPAQYATQLPAPHTPQPPAPAHSLNQPLTLAEIEVGLQQLHNGTSGALHGYTSELLRYAKLVATPDDPAPAHLLAPCLLVLFNAAFSTGQVPKSWKTSLVTPVFKHGAVSVASPATPQIRPTTGRSQWVSQSAGYMPASWYSA